MGADSVGAPAGGSAGTTHAGAGTRASVKPDFIAGAAGAADAAAGLGNFVTGAGFGLPVACAACAIADVDALPQSSHKQTHNTPRVHPFDSINNSCACLASLNAASPARACR
jgi:hypothetical protein